MIIELVKEVGTKITPVWGPTTLDQPETNQADPLVNLVTTLLAGHVRLVERFQDFSTSFDPFDLEGEDLTIFAALIGSPRKIDQQSKVPVIVAGKSGAALPSGSILLDAAGNEWVTTVDAVVSGYGWTNACSPIGAFDLTNGELQLQSSVSNIFGATNAASPEIGGVLETDDALRRRLSSRRPHWQVKETVDAVLFALMQLTGVLSARFITDIPDCLQDVCGARMIGILGGDDTEIAQAVFDNAPYSVESLIGQTTITIRCTDVTFQRLCPLLIEVKYWTRCDCTTIDLDDIEQKILDALNEIQLRTNTLSITTLCQISNDLIKVEFKPVPMELTPDGCPATYTDSVTGLPYSTDDPASHCLIGPDCQEFSDCLVLNDIFYPIFVLELITRDPDCPCPTTDMECGCGNE